MRDAKIDAARCVANYLIVLLHAGGAACQYGVPGSIEYGVGMFLTEGFGNVALAALFLLSGYLLFRNFDVSSWPRKMGNRLVRLGVPYLVWNLLFVAFYLGCARFVPRMRARVDAFGLDSFGGAASKVIDLFEQPIDVPLWYVRALLVFVLLSPALWLVLRHRVGRWIGFAALAAYFVWGLLPYGAQVGVKGYPAFALLAFFAGGIVAVSGRTLFEVFRGRVWLVVGCGGLGFDAAAQMGCTGVPEWSVRMLMKVPLFFWVMGHPWVNGLAARPWFTLARDSAFFVFVGHFLFCSLWLHGLAPLVRGWPCGQFTVLVLLFCGPGVVMTIAIHRLFRRWLPWVARVFDGTLG